MEYNLIGLEVKGCDLMVEFNKNFLSADEVISKIDDSYKLRKKLSVVRLGDGEALALAQDIVLPISEIRKRSFLPYAGLVVPNLKARDEIAESIRRASIIGVANNSLPDFTPLLLKALGAHNIDINNLLLTNACINYFLLEEDRLKKFLLRKPKPRVLLVGNKTDKLATIMRRSEVRVIAAIKPVLGVRDCKRVMKVITQYKFDVALVSAGIAAVMLSEKIANHMNKIAIDFGHATDEIIKKNIF